MSYLKTTAIQHLNASTPAINLDANGRVGIGTSSPGHRLHIVDSSSVNYCVTRFQSDSRTYDFGVGGSSTGSFSNALYVFDVNAGLERFKIDSSGRVTKPYQPMFRAANSSSNITVTAGQEIMFNSIGYNVGSHYNSSTSRFTCPVSGYYLFSLHVFDNTNANVAERRYSFAVNGSGIGQWTKVDDTTKGGSHTSTLIQYLSAGDFVSVTTGYSNGVFFGGHSFFMGYLLG